MQTFDEKLEVFNEAKRTGRTVMARRHNVEKEIKASWKMIHEDTEYYLAPETITVNEVEVPAPMSKKPEIEQFYWVFDAAEVSGVDALVWVDDEVDNLNFEGGHCFKSSEDCRAYVKAQGWRK